MALLDNLIEGWDVDPEDNWRERVQVSNVGQLHASRIARERVTLRPVKEWDVDPTPVPEFALRTRVPRSRPAPVGSHPEPEPVDDSWRAEVFGTAEQRDRALGR